MEEMTKLYLCDGHACDSLAYDERHQSLGCIKNRDGFCMRTSSEEHALHNQQDFPKTDFKKWFPDDSILVEIISELNSEDDTEIEPVVRQWQQKLNDSKDDMSEKESIEALIEPTMCEALNQITDSMKQDFKPKSLDDVINEELDDVDFSDATFTDGLTSGLRIATKFSFIEMLTNHPFGIMPTYGEFEEE